MQQKETEQGVVEITLSSYALVFLPPSRTAIVLTLEEEAEKEALMKDT